MLVIQRLKSLVARDRNQKEAKEDPADDYGIDHCVLFLVWRICF